MKSPYHSMAMRGRVFGALPSGANPISSLVVACLRWLVHRMQKTEGLPPPPRN